MLGLFGFDLALVTHHFDKHIGVGRVIKVGGHLVYAVVDQHASAIVSLEDLTIAVEDSLRQDFQVPFVSLILFSDNPMPVRRWVKGSEAQTAIGGLLSEGKTISGTLREHELDFLFGEDQRVQIGSTAVVALNHQGLHGVLAIASRDPQHYKSTVGTLFLTYIAEVLSRSLPRFTTALRAVR